MQPLFMKFSLVKEKSTSKRKNRTQFEGSDSTLSTHSIPKHFMNKLTVLDVMFVIAVMLEDYRKAHGACAKAQKLI